MYAGARYAWKWLKQLTKVEEQKFSKSLEPMDSTKKDDYHKSRLFWTFSDLVLVTMCFQIDLIYLCDMGFMLKNDRNPGFLQIMVMYATCGPALIYMEIFLGQYVQHGCLYLKNMSPLSCSTIGYAMLFTMYCYSVATIGRLGDAYMFIFRSFSSELPWMVCPKDSTPATCIDRALLVECYLENKQDDCYPKLRPELFSSRIYYKAIHATFVNRTTLLLIGWLTIYIALKRTLSDTRVVRLLISKDSLIKFQAMIACHKKVMAKRLLLFMLVLFLCLLTPLAVYVGRGFSVVPFFSLRQGAVFDVASWMAAFKSFLRDHATVRGGWQLIGCHIKPGPTAANLTIYSCALTYIVTVFSQLFSTGILGVLIFYMKITHPEEELYFPRYAKLFNFYPFALGMLQVRQVWSLIYFALVALSSISYTVVNMAILEESMYDDFPVMLRYQDYVKVSLCILGFLIGIVSNLLNGLDTFEDEFMLQIGNLLTKVIVLILTFSVGYIYGMERFSDDMNFLNGSQPTTYWKICWKSLPFGILILIGGDVMAIDFPRDDLARITSNIVCMILLALAVLRLLYQIAISIKARNVAGILFQATPLWGPPLPEDRRLRNTYNPREETKYWRKNNLCTHHCLLNKDFIFTVIFREIDSRTNKTRDNDMLQQDFAPIPEQSKQNQVVIAIDKVSSAQLETFEEQVKQKVKMLEQLEENEVNLQRKQSKVPRRVTATRSMDELDYRIEQMIEQAEQKAELERGNNAAEARKTISKTKQRRIPTFVPKETPRSKKTPKALDTTHRKDAKDTETSKFYTYAVQVPQFVLEPLEQIHRYPTSPENVQESENLKASTTSPSPAFFSSQSTSCRVSQRQTILKPRFVMKKQRLPVWPLPLDTPRPTVSTRLSQSSSTSTVSRELAYLNVGLPPKANLHLSKFSVDFHSQSESSGSSTVSLELSVLNHDPVLREILRSVHPELIPTTQGNTFRDSLPISSLTGSSRSPRSPPRKQESRNPPSPCPRPRRMEIKPIVREAAFEAKALWPIVKNETADSSAMRAKKRTKKKVERAEEEESVVNIDQAIQIRIDNLLRGVRNPGQITDQRTGSLSVLTKAKTVSRVVREQYRYPKRSKQGQGSSQNSSYVSKTKKKLSDQSRTTSIVTSKISAVEKRIAKRMTRGLNSSRIHRDPQTTDENNIQPETFSSVIEEAPEATTLDMTLTGYNDPVQSSLLRKNKRENCDEKE